MTRDEMLNLVQRWQESFARRDFQTFGDLYAADAIYESPLVGGAITGREAILQGQHTLLNAFPDGAVTPLEPPIVDGDRVALVAELAGTQVGNFLGLAPTGKAIHVRIVFLLDVRNGQIVHDRRIYDFTGLLVQVGVLKAKPA